jgi:hypothetical protein
VTIQIEEVLRQVEAIEISTIPEAAREEVLVRRIQEGRSQAGILDRIDMMEDEIEVSAPLHYDLPYISLLCFF